MRETQSLSIRSIQNSFEKALETSGLGGVEGGEATGRMSCMREEEETNVRVPIIQSLAGAGRSEVPHTPHVSPECW